MTPQEYAAAVAVERKALAKLQRMLKAWGSTASLFKVEEAWVTWQRLAVLIEGAQAGTAVPATRGVK